ncbi:MAG: succinate dehydrogenase cytochrome b subunit [Marinifilaceae bacterium]
MSKALTSSIFRKAVMSLSGLFLISFLCIHLALNLLLIADSTGEMFNLGAHFMATNPIIKVIEPVLAIGFIIHILLAIKLTLENRKSRPVRYAVSTQAGNATWASRNMFILGGLILAFLVVHIYNFWWNIKITGDLPMTLINGEEAHDTYALVAGLFRESVIYCVVYIIGAIFLGFHLAHGFWSAFQSIGLCNGIWRKRLECLAYLFAIVMGVGFGIIPIYFLIFG